MFTVLIICDTHGHLNRTDLISIKNMSDSSVSVFFLGDVPYQELTAIMLEIGNKPSYGIIGNHDEPQLLENFGIQNIHGKIIEINGIKFVGMGGTFRYKNGLPLSFSQDESLEFVSSLPKADILLSHDSIYNPNKLNEAHQGLQGINWYIRQYHPRLFIHGHLHETSVAIIRNRILRTTKNICVYKYQSICI